MHMCFETLLLCVSFNLSLLEILFDELEFQEVKQVLKMLNENNILPDTKIIFYLAKFLKERKTLGC
jgi:predicted ATPase